MSPLEFQKGSQQCDKFVESIQSEFQYKDLNMNELKHQSLD